MLSLEGSGGKDELEAQRLLLCSLRFSRDSATIRIDNESPNDRNDRGQSLGVPLLSCSSYLQNVEADQLTPPSFPPSLRHSAIRHSLRWYNTHLAESSPSSSSKGKGKASKGSPFVVMISDDVDNRKKAELEGLKAYSGELAFLSVSCYGSLADEI